MASSSTSLQTRKWTYDVFISFRGFDTRNNFVNHLYTALIQHGIRAFKDDEALRRGQPISPELQKAIDESRFAVVVFSPNFAESSWCLDELSKIMESQDRQMVIPAESQDRQTVIPVFYYVDPSDVRHQKGSFGTSFQQLVERFEMEKLKKWGEALTAASNLSGFEISKKVGESTIISKIVQEILGGVKPLGNENNLVGIKSRIDALYSSLGMDARDAVRMVGVLGMGGIGKTTIAHALFRRISYLFEGNSFVKGVRIIDICELQKKILKDVLKTNNKFTINDPEEGAEMIQTRLCNKKVLLVLDDVDDVKQLEFLAATHEWFGPGSRIIITTRDAHVLSDTDETYQPSLLVMDQAIELFSRHAFRDVSPPDGYKKLTDRAIRYTGYLPLALKVLGSFFRGRHAGVWESALNRIAETPNSEIFRTLKLSYDGLEESEKKIFLDIACFFKGKEVKDVSRVLDCCGFYAGIGISALIEKCLITVSNGKLEMHDLLQEMGRQIARENFPNSRLWQPQQILDSIKMTKQLEVVEAIVMPSSRDQVDLSLSADVFESMTNLRLLHVQDKFTSALPTILPDQLRSLIWNNYPFLSLPDGHMDRLVELEINRGQLQCLWEGKKAMPNLKFLHLKGLKISRFPDVSGAPNIERLILSDCGYLLEVHESVGSLRKLVCLDLSWCWRLKSLPSSLYLESLETLNFSFLGLERFPEFSPCMVKLSHIDSHCCHGIKELPSSIGYLSNLNILNLRRCINLESIPNSICELKQLRSLFLENCRKLQKLPEEFGRLENLQELDLGVGDVPMMYKQLPKFINLHAFTNLCSLRKLNLKSTQLKDEDFPKSLHGLSSLERLNLSYNQNLTRLPASISHLTCLKHLELNKCSKIQSLYGLPIGIQVLKACFCTSLKNIPGLSKEHESLSKIQFLNCHQLLKNEESKRYIDKMLKQSFFQKYAAVDGPLSVTFPGNNIPSCFKEQRNKHQIALKLPPNWQTRIAGFALCAVFNQYRFYNNHLIKFQFENDGAIVSKFEVDRVDAYKTIKDGNVWLGYVPFSFFQQQMQHHDDGFQQRIIEGNNLFINMNLSDCEAERCGAQIVYKDDVEQITPRISNYWNWELIDTENTITISEAFFEEFI